VCVWWWGGGLIVIRDLFNRVFSFISIFRFIALFIRFVGGIGEIMRTLKSCTHKRIQLFCEFNMASSTKEGAGWLYEYKLFFLSGRLSASQMCPGGLATGPSLFGRRGPGTPGRPPNVVSPQC